VLSGIPSHMFAEYSPRGYILATFVIRRIEINIANALYEKFIFLVVDIS